jgi:hypothetical protein
LATPSATDPIFAALEAFRSADAAFYADVSGDIPDAIGNRWSQAVDDVISTQPTTPAGLGALTSFARDMTERSNRGDAGFGDRQWVPVAAAIDDATRGMSGLRPWSPVSENPAEPSDATALVEHCRRGDRRWDVLGDEINEIEEAARKEHGCRPIALIAWRNYSAIGCSEIERARDEFLAAGIDAKTVQKEYRAAKKRELAIERAGDDWDRKVGLTDLRKEYEDVRNQARVDWEALGKIQITNVGDAAAIIGVLRERMQKFDELSDDWEIAAFMNASRFLVSLNRHPQAGNGEG